MTKPNIKSGQLSMEDLYIEMNDTDTFVLVTINGDDVPDGLPRSCRYCSEMVCGDINWCEVKHRSISDKALPKVRECEYWSGNDIAADSFEVWMPKKEPKPKHCEGQMLLEVADD